MKKKINIVWLKRDLRTQDHLPFFEAENSELDYISIYIFDSSLIFSPDTSLRHLQFVYYSLEAINNELKKYKRKVGIYHAESLDVFKELNNEFEIKNVFSYQETGILNTWKRDIQISKFLKLNNVNWIEFQKDAIVRGIKNRDNSIFGFNRHLFPF